MRQEIFYPMFDGVDKTFYHENMKNSLFTNKPFDKPICYISVASVAVI
jgi:hypothetical protein